MYERKLRDMFEQTKTDAEHAIDQGNQQEAARLYGRCADILRSIASNSQGALKEKRLEMAEKYEEIRDNLLGKSTSLQETRQRAASVTQETEEDTGDMFKEYAERFRQDTSVTWDDVAGMEETKQEIKETFALSAIENKPAGVEGINTILLYGPPGTGKTLLSSALAGSHSYPFFNVQLSQALSKYYGESGKIISAIFDAARDQSPSILFFDEFDSVALSRGGNMDEATRRVLSTLLTELSGFGDQDEEVLFIGATNAPWDLDTAILSRIERIVYVPLPDAETAEKILRLNTEEKEIAAAVDLAAIATECVQRNYSGREVRNVAREAIRRMVQEENPDLSQLAAKPVDEIKTYELQTRPLQQEDFTTAFTKIEAKADPQLIQQYEQWAEQFNA